MTPSRALYADQSFEGKLCGLWPAAELLPDRVSQGTLLAVGDRTLRIRGSMVTRLLGLLRTPRRFEELAEIAGRGQAIVLVELLRRLRHAGFLYIDSGSSDTPDAASNLERAARNCAAQLGSSSRGTSPAEQGAYDSTIWLHGTGCLTFAVAELLETLGHAPIVEPSLGVRAAQPGAAAFAVAVTEGTGVDGLRGFDAACREQDRPWLWVRLTGALLRVGPWFARGRGPCLACYSHRRAATAPDARDFAELEATRGPVPALAPQERIDARILWCAAQQIATAIMRQKFRGNDWPLPPVGTFLDLDLTELPDGSYDTTADGVVLRVPGCATCDRLAAPTRRPPRAGAGVVRHCNPLPLGPLDPKLACWIAEARRLEIGRPVTETENVIGVGVALDADAARAAAIGEAIERYGAAIYDPTSAVYGGWTELAAAGRNAVRPDRVAPHSAAQLHDLRATFGTDHRLRLFDETTHAAWIQARNITRDEAVLVPAALVYLPYRPRRDEPEWNEGTSTGLAVASDSSTATLLGLLEVIERDALASGWLVRQAWPRIDLRLLPRLERLWHDRLACPHIDLHLADLTTDIGLPVVAAVLEHARGGVVVGTAARFTTEEAAIKATLEAHQARLAWKQPLEHGVERAFAADFRDVRTFADHAVLAATAEHGRRVIARVRDVAPRLNGFQSVESRPEQDPAAALNSLVSRLADLGFDVITADITPLDVADIGYRLNRVLVPGLVPLNGHHLLRPLGMQARLEKVKRTLAHGSVANRDEIELDPTPHPFP